MFKQFVPLFGSTFLYEQMQPTIVDTEQVFIRTLISANIMHIYIYIIGLASSFFDIKFESAKAKKAS